MNQQVTVISVSRITPYKGFHHLITAFNALDPKINATLIICGSHPQKKYLRHLQKISGERVIIIVNPKDSVLSSLYQKADIYATCDKYLFFGMPPLEAASFGLPTIAMNFAAAAENIKDKKTGFVVKNEIEFKEKLEKLVKDKNLCQKMGKNAQKFARKFSWEKTAKEYEKIFKDILGNKDIDIALITHEINGHSGSRAPLEIAKALAINCKITIYAYPDNFDIKLAASLRKDGLSIKLLPHKGNSFTAKIKNAFFLKNMLASADHNLNFSHCSFPLFSALYFSKKPLVATYYGTQKNVFTEHFFPNHQSLAVTFFDRLSNLLIYLQQWLMIKKATQSVAISKYTQKEAALIYKKKIPYIYLGAISNSLKK